ncbi:hypothetical protein ONZ45_g2611 [Pleurotus djamor]|nr:hypothetical protein ONZ45_g2611 [Pleurotus djamor]
MRVLVLGATGALGIEVVRGLLAAKLSPTVVVYARSPEKLPSDISSDTRVVVIKGGLTDRDDLEKALEGVDAVVSLLGPIVTKGPFHPSGTPIAKGYAILVELMKKLSIKRLIALGTASITDPEDKFDLKFAALVAGVATFARSAYKDVVAWGEVIRKDGAELDWTIMRVPVLTSDASKAYGAGYIGHPGTSMWLSRAAGAAFAVEEIEKREWVKKAPLVHSA